MCYFSALLEFQHVLPFGKPLILLTGQPSSNRCSTKCWGTQRRNNRYVTTSNNVASAPQVMYFYQALPKSYQQSLLTQCQRCKRPISLRSFCNAVFFSFSNAACTREKSDSASPSCSSKLRSRARCCFSFASWSGETDGTGTRQATFLQSLVVGHDGAQGKIQDAHRCTLHWSTYQTKRQQTVGVCSSWERWQRLTPIDLEKESSIGFFLEQSFHHGELSSLRSVEKSRPPISIGKVGVHPSTQNCFNGTMLPCQHQFEQATAILGGLPLSCLAGNLWLIGPPTRDT